MAKFFESILYFSVLQIRVLDVLILLLCLGVATLINKLIVDRLIPAICARVKRKNEQQRAAYLAMIEAEKLKAEAEDAARSAAEQAQNPEAGQSPETVEQGQPQAEDAAGKKKKKAKSSGPRQSRMFARKQRKFERLPLFDIVFSSLGKPIHYLVLSIACAVALLFMNTPEWAREIRPWLFTIIRAVTIWCVILYLLRVTDRCKEHFAKIAALTKNDKLDDMLVPLIAGIVKILLIAFGILVVIQNLGYSVTSLVAGLGIGGAALALASKDTLANMFGAFVVFVDRPFQIGDWIAIGGVEGIVEEIRLRTTLIRTWDNSVVTLPNSMLSTGSIDNFQRRKYRKMECDFGVLYSTTAAQIEQIVADIKAHLAAHVIDTDALELCLEKEREIRNDHRLTEEEMSDAIDRVRYVPKPGQIYGPNYFVGFKGFGDSSLDIEVVAFTYRTGKSGHMEDRQNFLLEIMRIVERNGTGFAFPTRTLEWAGDQSKIPIRMLSDGKDEK